MAVSLCKPPDPVSFTGNAARNWQEFEEQLTWFLAGTESSDKFDSVKIGIMLTHAGKEARTIYKTLPWSEPDDKTKFHKVLKAFRDYCQPRKNILYERHKFWNLQQEEGEPVDAYNTRLKVQIDHCDYEREGWPEAMMSVFSRHGIPNNITADNMPFDSAEFRQFAKKWDFTITTSSPNYPQSNGLVDRNVQTIKRLFRKAKESNTSTDIALLEYRNTPISVMALSPSQLLMSRRLRSNLPMTETLLISQVSETAREQLQKRQQKQVQYYNRGTRPLLPLSQGDVVRYKTGSKWQPAVIVSKHTAPRSYNIQTATGNIIRRNRRHLKRTVEAPPELYHSAYDDDDDEMVENPQDPPMSSNVPEQSQPSGGSGAPHVRVSRYGRHIRLPVRYRDATQT